MSTSNYKGIHISNYEEDNPNFVWIVTAKYISASNVLAVYPNTKGILNKIPYLTSEHILRNGGIL